jgi:predicted O-methyltransferase YrrM
MKFWSKPVAPQMLQNEDVLDPLPERFRLPLLSMYAGEPQLGTNGEMFEPDRVTIVRPEEGMWIYNLCRQLKPQKTIEVGLAYGYSTIYILAALHANGFGSHIAIDPYQSYFHDIGIHQPEKVNMMGAFRWICEKSITAIADLSRGGEIFEFIFIDGSHRFDDALVDFTISADVCAMGGHIILDDMWMPPIQRAVSFIRNNRKDFVEIETPIQNIAAFKRIGKDTRRWDHHADF